VSHFDDLDVDHVAALFPALERNNYLIQRLGSANTRRRQLLRYREERHASIAGPRGETSRFRDEVSEPDAGRFDSLSMGQPTTAKQAGPASAPPAAEEEYGDAVEIRSEGGTSQTSYASSRHGSGRLRVPDPAYGDPFGGVPFQCAYCFTQVSPASRESWV